MLVGACAGWEGKGGGREREGVGRRRGPLLLRENGIQEEELEAGDRVTKT